MFSSQLGSLSIKYAIKGRNRWYPMKTITDADYVEDLALLAYSFAQTKSLLLPLEQAARSIGVYITLDKTEFMCFNQDAAISSLNGELLKLVERFIYFGCNISSTESNINICMNCYWQINNLIELF